MLRRGARSMRTFDKWTGGGRDHKQTKKTEFKPTLYQWKSNKLVLGGFGQNSPSPTAKWKINKSVVRWAPPNSTTNSNSSNSTKSKSQKFATVSQDRFPTSDDQFYKPSVRSTVANLNPRKIRAYLDEHVIGQDALKKTLSVAIYNHYKRVEANLQNYSESTLNPEESIFPEEVNFNKFKREKQDSDPVNIEKSNVILAGPTGCGKTLVAKTTAKLLDVPFSMNDATPLTQAGYVGEDAEICISRLLQTAEYDVERAERGIVFLDEIDKIARRTDAASPNQRDVSGEGVQHSLLRMLEGTIVNVTVKGGSASRHGIPNGEVFSVDTSNILFICSGAFVGLDRIIQDRIGKRASIGFGAEISSTNGGGKQGSSNESEILQSVEPSDFVRYGFIPEFVGRMPVIATAQNLTEYDLVKVLQEPKNALIKQYQKIFQQCGMSLDFHKGAVSKMAKNASQTNTGARGLRRILENVLQDSLYRFPGTDVVSVVVLPETVDGSKPVASFKIEDQALVKDSLIGGKFHQVVPYDVEIICDNIDEVGPPPTMTQEEAQEKETPF